MIGFIGKLDRKVDGQMYGQSRQMNDHYADVPIDGQMDGANDRFIRQEGRQGKKTNDQQIDDPIGR